MRQAGGLLLEALMLVFIFVSSLSNVTQSERHGETGLVVSATSFDPIAFRDSDSSSESLLSYMSKMQVVCSDFVNAVLDLPSLAVFNSERFFISHCLYNIFYTHLTAKAP
jgi:hypothetical protein